jgi:hypothetical protein
MFGSSGTPGGLAVAERGRGGRGTGVAGRYKRLTLQATAFEKTLLE